MALHPNRRLLTQLLTVSFAGILLKTAWISDDAYITLRTVRNLLDGFGPVWNVGERVQAYTHPLWMLLLTAFISVTDEYFYTPILLSMALSLTAFFVLLRYVSLSTAGAVIGGIILILSKGFTDYSTSGLENPLVHLLLAIFFARYFRHEAEENVADPTPGNLFWLALIAGLGGVARLDALLLFAPPLLYAAWRGRYAGLRVPLALAAGMIPLLAWEFFSLLYYGFPFPNTAYAKLSTGLPLAELLPQGLHYLKSSAGVDLLTAMILAVGLILPWITRRRAEAAISIGIALYLLYVARIGGDFMVGRFLSAPLLCAVIPLMRYPYGEIQRWVSILLLAAIVAVGLANPKQSPLLANMDYNVPYIDSNGIADERGHYYQRFGLLPAGRLNRLPEQGIVRGTPDPHNFTHCGIGMRGFLASPYTHIIDECGLADPLLARLPAAYDPAWRVGHPLRGVPPGYQGTTRTGENRLADPQLAEFYDRLTEIASGPLWSSARLAAIWRMNLGRYDHLIDETRYRYPETVNVETSALAYALDEQDNEGVRFGNSGLLIDLGSPRHAESADLGINLETFTLLYYLDREEIGQTSVGRRPLRLGDEDFTIVKTPETVAENGFSALRILPDVTGEPLLRHFVLVDGNSAELIPLLRRYYSAFYWRREPERTQTLAQLVAQLEAVESEEWRTLSAATIIDLWQMPTSALHSLMAERLSFKTLATEEKQPRLQVLGFTARSTNAEDAHQGIRLQLAFEVLAPFEEPYTVWFHITAVQGDDEFMIYDYSPMDSTLTWAPGDVVLFEPTLTVEPGEYEVSTGFWTPGTRQRLYLDDGETYWLNLGQLTAADAGADEK